MTIHGWSPTGVGWQANLGETVYRMSRPARLAATLVILAVAGCGDTGTDRTDNADKATGADAFCSAMAGVAVRMAADTGTPTPPQGLREDFDEVVALLDRAERHAPCSAQR